ncbi:SURF1 family protein [Reinekea marina]|uniref:SURF1-like protein n=1 Tax=Reinekea marina TaxID=1310421 RepID=A0ABV7WR69_9GAMM|nr:SURF1 family protein [Reinekea marina]MDN3647697.1 SURF1 family protein [Reinekea marina]
MKVPVIVVLKRFKPGKLLTVFFTVFFCLFLTLGFWQLNRAHEKSILAEQVNSSASQFEASTNPSPYQSFKIAGQFTELPTFYMDNRTLNGQAGYEVWLFFETKQGRWLVSSGWVAGLNTREKMPSFELSTKPQAIEIIVRPDSENPMYGVDTNTPLNDGKSVWLVQSLNQQWIENLYPKKPLLGLAQLKDSELFGVGPSVWQPSVMTVEKHLGYSLQWFGMSIALLGMFLYAGFSRKQQQ